MRADAMGGNDLFFRTIFAVVAWPIVAGQSCSSETPYVAEELLAPCAEVVAAQCTFLANCLPVLFGTQFGDIDACVSRNRVTCEGYARWQGVRWTAEKFQRCAEHVQRAACTEIETLPTGPCESVPGSLPNGSSCVDSIQCASGYCQQPATPGGVVACGTCAEGACRPDSCPAGEVCVPSSQCMAIVAEGAPCTSSSICAAGSSCVRGLCTKGHNEGESCATSVDCDSLQELTCVDGTCRKSTLVDIGAPCSGNVRCARGGICKSDQASAPSTCRAPLDDGAACGGARTSDCRPPARCRGGTCTLPAELTCP